MRGMRIGWVVLLSIAVAAVGCNKKEQEPAAPAKVENKAPEAKPAEAKPAPAAKQADPAHKLLDAAIAARGGLAKLKAIGGMTMKTSGTYMGMPYTANSYVRPGDKMRLDVNMPGGEKMTMMFGLQDCWTQSGPVVMPCMKDEQESDRQMVAFDKALMLWPLLEKDWQLTAGKVKQGDRELDSLAVANTALGIDGKLLFDPETHMVVGGSCKGKHMGQEGEFAYEYSDYKDFCEVKMPGASKTTFGGKPYMDEKCLEVECSAVADEKFAKPEQVKDGTIAERQIPGGTIACFTMKGPYTGMKAAMDKLTKFMQEQKLTPMGPPMMVYLKGPPRVKKAKRFVTDVCFPVAAPAPKKPSKKGAFTVKGMKPMQVLSAYGIGDYNKKSPQLMKLLIKEAKKRKLKAAGPIGQIAYSVPGTTPPERYVSEMMLPIKGKPAKKHHRKK